MMKCFSPLLIGFILLATPLQAGEPVSIIFDTDMASDCDDIAALTVLHALADAGEANILAVTTNTKDASNASAAACDVINTFFGRPNIPIGTDKDGKKWYWRDTPSSYTGLLRDQFPHDCPPDSECPDALTVLRKTLASQPDGSVVICSVGALSNLADLIESTADDLSPLTGRELIQQKVRWTVIMGGGFPRTSAPETNIRLDVVAAAEVATEWPGPILWQGFEIGTSLITGQELQALPDPHPLKVAFAARPYREVSALDRGKPSHDQAAVLLAVRGVEKDLWKTVSGGRVVVDTAGHTYWDPLQGLPQHWWPDHQYVQFKAHQHQIAEIISNLMNARKQAAPLQ